MRKKGELYSYYATKNKTLSSLIILTVLFASLFLKHCQKGLNFSEEICCVAKTNVITTIRCVTNRICYVALLLLFF